MRVALLASGFADYSLELGSALAELCTVRLLLDVRAAAREGVQPPPQLQCVALRQHSRLQRWGGLAPGLARLARFRPDAIVAHEHPHPHLTALLRLARRIAPVGLIVHDPQPHPGRDLAFAARRTADILAQRRLAARLFTHGAAGAQLLERLSERPVLAIRHGPILRPATPSPPPGAGRVLMFGRMEAYKGLEVLLAAHQRLRARGFAPTLDLRGEGPELDRLATAFQTAGGCEVTRGHAARADLLQALAACDLVLAPYLQASGSGVAAAALAHGRGLVGSAVGALPDAARPGCNGVLVPPGDPQALADAILAGLAQAPALGRGATALAAGPFAWRRTAETLLDAFAGVAQGAA